MTVRNLSHQTLDEVLDCFLLAFDNYFVPLPKDRDYFIRRWQAAGVDLSSSYGMFDQGQMVGFILNAVGRRLGYKTAFNTGTGVLPQYRGKGITKSIYQFALPDLKKQGFERSTLEVITQNVAAIKAYQSVGFVINKHYKCFKGIIQVTVPEGWSIIEIPMEQVDWTALPLQHLYSWDNQPETLVDGSYQMYHVYFQDKLESYFILDEGQQYLAQFDLFSTDSLAWDRLFAAIQTRSPQITVNNIAEELDDKITCLQRIGLINHIDQYEMGLILAKPPK